MRRPSRPALLIVAPITGAACSIDHTSLLWAFAYIALAAAAFIFGVRARHRGALYGGAVSTVIAVAALRELFNFALEWKCIAAGTISPRAEDHPRSADTHYFGSASRVSWRGQTVIETGRSRMGPFRCNSK
ncbi:MAG TPA: hypothetical protein VGK31_13220 [Thermoanaerobaculia bacterium]